jgi:paraquat-inducible protein B
MSEQVPIPEGEVAERSRLSIMWIVPIVALIVAAGLAYRTITERGPLITITFETGDGIEVDKTTLQYRAVPFGTVEEVSLGEDIHKVEVRARISPDSAKHITKGTRFWVVRPRVGASGISGLGTLLSGAYIAVEPGPAEAPAELNFVGLEEPPLIIGDAKALSIVLEADALRDLSSGSPVYYRDIQAGTIVGHEIDAKSQKIQIRLAVDHEHAALVRKNSHFWNVGGVEMDASFTGVELNLESLRSLIAGGIAFDTHGAQGEPAKEGDRFALYDGLRESKDAWRRSRTTHIVVEGTSLGSIRSGEPVLYNGVEVGTVLSYKLKEDAATIGILLGIEPKYAPLVRTNSVFWNASGIDVDVGLSGIHVHTASFAALVSGAVAFATPNDPDGRAASGSVFKLHNEPKDSWLKWRPHIWLGPKSKRPKTGPVAATTRSDAAKPELVHHEGADPAEKKDSHHWWSNIFHSDGK